MAMERENRAPRGAGRKRKNCLLYTSPLNLQKVQESPIRGGIIEESINDTHKWEAERMARNILVVEDDRNISCLLYTSGPGKWPGASAPGSRRRRSRTSVSYTHLDVYKRQEVFLLDLATGLRRGELMALQWDDLNFKTGVLNVNKQVYDCLLYTSSAETIHRRRSCNTPAPSAW